ncbi:hypothetical protein [Haloferula sp. BvORR071]|uniref:hypothetical protein n=1 Tax=Haloferula sp. BvORR071 TaxID=1396141 RepID=UPI00054CEB55|nr:hypothetical protein [Haloferula sp. BvORR071]
MNTRASDHYTSHGEDLEADSRDKRASRDIPQPVDTESHWNDLHRSNGFRQEFMEKARRHVRNASIADIAGAALAGLALGYILFSPRRSNGLRQMLLGSMTDANKGAHDAWDSLRHNRTLSDLGDRVVNFSDHVGDRFSDLADRAAKLRRRW